MTVFEAILLTVVLISVLALLSLGAYLGYPLVQRWLEIQNRAAHDYQAARGTQHRKMLEQSLGVVQQRIASQQRAIAHLRQQLSALQARENEALDRALLRHQLETNISGIGSRLAAQIEQQVYRGNLGTLQYAARYVAGVGPKKQAAINAWLGQVAQRWPALRQSNFPGKASIIQQFQSPRQDKQRELDAAVRRLKEMQLLADKATVELSRLSAVTMADFVQAYQSRGNGVSDEISAYVIGTFAEWEEMPHWFKSLITDYVE